MNPDRLVPPAQAPGHTAPERSGAAVPGGPASAYAPPARSRGSIALAEENCTVCMLCARECPSWCITIDAHDETGPPLSPGGRPRSRYVLDRFAIDWSLCMYCGICVEVCPFDALFWTPDAEYPATLDGALVHERERLRAWLDAVPPPEPPDALEPPPA